MLRLRSAHPTHDQKVMELLKWLRHRTLRTPFKLRFILVLRNAVSSVIKPTKKPLCHGEILRSRQLEQRGSSRRIFVGESVAVVIGAEGKVPVFAAGCRTNLGKLHCARSIRLDSPAVQVAQRSHSLAVNAALSKALSGELKSPRAVPRNAW